ncbi:MAG: AAA family ATPase [Methylocapsa sp.]|nr:AAA family ATPase [Methylocapsa sp.]
MLQKIPASPRSRRESSLGTPEHGAVGVNLGQSFRSIAAIVHRQLPIFVLVPFMLALGLLYIATTPPAYTAVAKILIDTHKLPTFQQQQEPTDQPIDNIAVATQVEVLTSENVSLAVIKDLELTKDPEFTGPGTGLIGAIRHLISSAFESDTTQSETKLQRRALAAFEARRKISRVPQTYAVNISFWSVDPGKASRIANAIGEAYVNDQLEARYESTRRASAWLRDRINNLRAEASADSWAVVEFKQKNNIVESGGKLMNEQQMGELNSQLTLARAATAEAKARLERIKEVMSKDIPDDSVADALNNQVVIKLRQQYLELVGRESIWSKQYGPNHLATIGLRNQIAELRRNIADEMQKIADSYQSDYEIALAREKSIVNSLKTSVAQSNITNQAQVQLRELESKAQTSQSTYDNFLQRYTEAVQQQSFPVSEARLITPATPPQSRSHPNRSIILAASAAIGIMIAFGAAVLREAASRVFWTGAQVKDVLHVSCLAMLPLLKPAGAIADGNQDYGGALTTETRHIRQFGNLLTYAVAEPLSLFTESLRSLKVAADLSGTARPNKVIGFTSTLPEEGKSTIAANFAGMIAHAGSRVVLIDADLRNSSLSRSFSPYASAGLAEVTLGQAALADVLWTDPRSGLRFLPAALPSGKVLHPNEILASAAIKSLISKLRDAFDYVVIDLPPLTPVVDTRTTTGFVASYVYVVEWGLTKTEVANHSLSDAPEVYERLLGVVLNKAKMSVVQRYEPHRNAKYYTRYVRYGKDSEDAAAATGGQDGFMLRLRRFRSKFQKFMRTG